MQRPSQASITTDKHHYMEFDRILLILGNDPSQGEHEADDTETLPAAAAPLPPPPPSLAFPFTLPPLPLLLLPIESLTLRFISSSAAFLSAPSVIVVVVSADDDADDDAGDDNIPSSSSSTAPISDGLAAVVDLVNVAVAAVRLLRSPPSYSYSGDSMMWSAERLLLVGRHGDCCWGDGYGSCCCGYGCGCGCGCEGRYGRAAVGCGGGCIDGGGGGGSGRTDGGGGAVAAVVLMVLEEGSRGTALSHGFGPGAS